MAVAEEQGPEKIAVSWAPVFGPSRLLGAVSGHPGCVDRRPLLLPDGRVAGTQRSSLRVLGTGRRGLGTKLGVAVDVKGVVLSALTR